MHTLRIFLLLCVFGTNRGLALPIPSGKAPHSASSSGSTPVLKPIEFTWHVGRKKVQTGQSNRNRTEEAIKQWRANAPNTLAATPGEKIQQITKATISDRADYKMVDGKKQRYRIVQFSRDEHPPFLDGHTGNFVDQLTHKGRLRMIFENKKGGSEAGSLQALVDPGQIGSWGTFQGRMRQKWSRYNNAGRKLNKAKQRLSDESDEWSGRRTRKLDDIHAQTSPVQGSSSPSQGSSPAVKVARIQSPSHISSTRLSDNAQSTAHASSYSGARQTTSDAAVATQPLYQSNSLQPRLGQPNSRAQMSPAASPPRHPAPTHAAGQLHLPPPLDDFWHEIRLDPSALPGVPPIDKPLPLLPRRADWSPL